MTAKTWKSTSFYTPASLLVPKQHLRASITTCYPVHLSTPLAV